MGDRFTFTNGTFGIEIFKCRMFRCDPNALATPMRASSRGQAIQGISQCLQARIPKRMNGRWLRLRNGTSCAVLCSLARRSARTVQNREPPFYPVIVSGFLVFAGFSVFSGSLDPAAMLRKTLWPCTECLFVLLKGFWTKNCVVDSIALFNANIDFALPPERGIVARVRRSRACSLKICSRVSGLAKADHKIGSRRLG
jgi:hypothetical protein